MDKQPNLKLKIHIWEKPELTNREVSQKYNVSKKMVWQTQYGQFRNLPKQLVE